MVVDNIETVGELWTVLVDDMESTFPQFIWHFDENLNPNDQEHRIEMTFV